MSISHWGLFPGWFVPAPEPDGSYAIKAWRPAIWQPVVFDVFCSVLDTAE